MIESRDEEWRRLLDDEITSAEKHFKKKTKSEIQLVQTKVMAEMKRLHSEDLETLTEIIGSANHAHDQ
jgi:hypothetical protein